MGAGNQSHLMEIAATTLVDETEVGKERLGVRVEESPPARESFVIGAIPIAKALGEIELARVERAKAKATPARTFLQTISMVLSTLTSARSMKRRKLTKARRKSGPSDSALMFPVKKSRRRERLAAQTV